MCVSGSCAPNLSCSECQSTSRFRASCRTGGSTRHTPSESIDSGTRVAVCLTSLLQTARAVNLN